jgi:anaerobic magnesium-protoporphyrin IX monomethyl ester cyclase
MKILLINPNRTYYAGSKGVRVGLPLGLMYLAGNLENNGYHPKILDCLIHPKTEIKTDEIKTVHGISLEVLSQEIREYQPDIVGISNPFTAQVDNAIKVANIVKEINPDIITVIGGPHASIAGDELLKSNQNIDISVVGEGEYTFLEIIKTIENNTSFDKVNNVIFRDSSGEIKITTRGDYIMNLDDLPLPAYHLIDMNLYFQMQSRGYGSRPLRKQRSISMITSRGCPFNCIFCSIHLHMGKRFRAHSAEYTIKHIAEVVTKYGVKHISFEDDNFTADINRATEILQGTVDQNIKITWDTPNGVRADRLTEDLAKLMKKSGCIELIFGVESGDQKVLNDIVDKNLNLDLVVKSAEICKRVGIKAKAFFVIGFPGEKIENIRKSMDFALMLRKKYGVRSGFMVATPLIGTRLYDICKKNGYLISEPDSKSLAIATQARGAGLIKTADFSPEDLKELSDELNKKMDKINFTEKISSISYYIKGIKLVIKHPVRVFKKLKNILS